MVAVISPLPTTRMAGVPLAIQRVVTEPRQPARRYVCRTKGDDHRERAERERSHQLSVTGSNVGRRFHQPHRRRASLRSPVSYRIDLSEDECLSYGAAFFSVLTIKKADRNPRGLPGEDSSCALKVKPHIKGPIVDHHKAIEFSKGRRRMASSDIRVKKPYRCDDV